MVASIDKPGMRETSREHGPPPNGLQTTRTYNRADNLVTDITAETAPGLDDRPGLSFSYTHDETAKTGSVPVSIPLIAVKVKRR